MLLSNPKLNCCAVIVRQLSFTLSVAQMMPDIKKQHVSLKNRVVREVKQCHTIYWAFPLFTRALQHKFKETFDNSLHSDRVVFVSNNPSLAEH